MEEQKEKIDEEVELRRALESARVQVLTTAERAKELLAAIRARRAEIVEADQKELIARGSISTAATNVRGQCMAKSSVTSKGKIKVSRSGTHSCNLEAGGIKNES